MQRTTENKRESESKQITDISEKELEEKLKAIQREFKRKQRKLEKVARASKAREHVRQKLKDLQQSTSPPLPDLERHHEPVSEQENMFLTADNPTFKTQNNEDCEIINPASQVLKKESNRRLSLGDLDLVSPSKQINFPVNKRRSLPFTCTRYSLGLNKVNKCSAGGKMMKESQHPAQLISEDMEHDKKSVVSSKVQTCVQFIHGSSAEAKSNKATRQNHAVEEKQNAKEKSVFSFDRKTLKDCFVNESSQSAKKSCEQNLNSQQKGALIDTKANTSGTNKMHGVDSSKIKRSIRSAMLSLSKKVSPYADTKPLNRLSKYKCKRLVTKTTPSGSPVLSLYTVSDDDKQSGCNESATSFMASTNVTCHNDTKTENAIEIDKCEQDDVQKAQVVIFSRQVPGLLTDNKCQSLLLEQDKSRFTLRSNSPLFGETSVTVLTSHGKFRSDHKVEQLTEDKSDKMKALCQQTTQCGMQPSILDSILIDSNTNDYVEDGMDTFSNASSSQFSLSEIANEMSFDSLDSIQPKKKGRKRRSTGDVNQRFSNRTYRRSLSPSCQLGGAGKSTVAKKIIISSLFHCLVDEAKRKPDVRDFIIPFNMVLKYRTDDSKQVAIGDGNHTSAEKVMNEHEDVDTVKESVGESTDDSQSVTPDINKDYISTNDDKCKEKRKHPDFNDMTRANDRVCEGSNNIVVGSCTNGKSICAEDQQGAFRHVPKSNTEKQASLKFDAEIERPSQNENILEVSVSPTSEEMAYDGPFVESTNRSKHLNDHEIHSNAPNVSQYSESISVLQPSPSEAFSPPLFESPNVTDCDAATLNTYYDTCADMMTDTPDDLCLSMGHIEEEDKQSINANIENSKCSDKKEECLLKQWNLDELGKIDGKNMKKNCDLETYKINSSLCEVGSFQLGKSDILITMVVWEGSPRDESPSRLCVACLSNSAIKLFMKAEESFTCVKNYRLPQQVRKNSGCQLYAVPGTSEVTLILQQTQSNCTCLFTCVYTGTDMLVREIDRLWARKVQVCVLDPCMLIVSYITYETTHITKYTSMPSQAGWSQRQLEPCRDHITSLAPISGVGGAVLGVSSSGKLYIWNHVVGCLLSTINISDLCPTDVSCPAAFSEQGYVFVPLLHKKKCKAGAGSVLVVNPSLGTSETLSTLDTSSATFTGCSRSMVCGLDMVVAREMSGHVTVWDTYSGTCLTTIADISVSCLTASKHFLAVAHKQCVHVYTVD